VLSRGVAADGAPVISITAPGAIKISRPDVPVLFSHDASRRYASTRESTLDVWADAYGLAFEFIPPSTPRGFSLVCGITEQRYCECSCGLDNVAAYEGGVGSHRLLIVDADLTEISVLPRGGCPGSACWSSASPLHGLSAAAREALPHWLAGQKNRRTWNCHREILNVA
jgi:phage head maturation protease